MNKEMMTLDNDRMQIFENSEFGSLEIVMIDGKPYFPATDCARILGYCNPQEAVRTHCKGVRGILTPSKGGNQRKNFIAEGNLYRLIIKSKLPAAERFEQWVFDEILPSIKAQNKSTILHSPQLPAVRESQEMQVFKNSEFGQIRTVLIDNEPWFVGKDIADVLGYVDTDKSIRNHVDSKDKLTRQFGGSGQSRKMTIISESGLYSLIFSSKLPNAKKFTYWVTSEVLPSIRKHGMYATEELLDNPEFAMKVFAALHEERQQRLAVERKNELLEEKNEVLEFKIEQDKPLVNFATAVSASDESIPVGDFAKLLNQNGLGIGRNRMFTWFRDNGYLIKSGASKNLPTQKYMDSGLFEIHESGYYNSYNEWQITLTTYITGKGQKYFFDKFFVSMSA